MHHVLIMFIYIFAMFFLFFLFLIISFQAVKSNDPARPWYGLDFVGDYPKFMLELYHKVAEKSVEGGVFFSVLCQGPPSTAHGTKAEGEGRR